MGNLTADQVTVSAISVYLLQLLKRSPWFPWIDENSGNINRLLAVLLALATAAGIHGTFEGGTLTITGLTLFNVSHFLFEAARSMAFQELIYRGVVKPKTETAVVVVEPKKVPLP